MDELSGSVERITFYNPENGYSVLRLHPDQRQISGLSRDGMATVVGNLPELTPGETVHLKGSWSTHPTHGLQFQVEICEQILPATLTGMRRYLGSGMVKGIGPRLANRIVDHFGLNTFDIIEKQPELLAQVADIGPKRTRLIAAAWAEQKQVKEIMLFLHSHAVSTNLAVKIYKQYGDQALQIVQTDPYRLAQDIYGVGFKTADRIAQALGLPQEHESRLEAGIAYSLQRASDEGHIYLPLLQLVEQSGRLLEVPNDLLLSALERLTKAGDVYQQEVPAQPATTPSSSDSVTAVYLTQFHNIEVSAASLLRSLAQAWPSRLSDLPPAFLPLDPSLSAEQQAAIRTALGSPVSVLTGGPGTGKTTAMRALIAALEEGRKRFALASPTGRAAKRLSQATGRPASTIHRLLGFSPGEGFKFNANRPLEIDLLVVDEASMLDLALTNHLLKALQPGTHLLLVGDIDQLPSVGAGDVLRDVIASGIAPVTRLNVIFRQAAHSHIITNAHRINQGEMPSFPSSANSDEALPPPKEGGASLGGDFFLFPAEKPEQAADWVLDLVCNRIPLKFGLHPRDDIQVLAPMYRGPAGVTALNERLQAGLNPASLSRPEKLLFGQRFRPGDKLMQLQNNYDKEVFNGDIGYLFAIDAINHTLTVDFEGRGVLYDWSEADQLTLAYAISVHKAQGCEFPAVVIPILTSHYLMLQRNLLYTAITRARKLCVLVGSKRAIAIAVHNDQVARRFTALDWRLTHRD